MDWKEFLGLGIDLAPVGLEVEDGAGVYFCTPKDAKILGWAGVDGIHFCTVSGFGEMVFAVSPMNFGDYVHPIARSVDDLLRLLLACGNMAALEQCHSWEEAQFEAFLLDNPVTEEQQDMLDAIGTKTGLAPMENAFAYIKTLQGEFDYGQIPYTEEYYDLDMNPAAPALPREWKVYYEGSFWGKGKGRAGKEIQINKNFVWGSENWYVPAVYACAKGLVVDFCVEVPPERIRVFIDKWQLPQLDGEQISQQMQEQMERENPLNISFRPVARVNGEEITAKSGCSVCWIPTSCLPEGEKRELEAEDCLTHYGMDKSRGWVLHRWNFPWVTAQRPKLKSLKIELKRGLTKMEGIHFFTPSVGHQVQFAHPVSGVEHTLTVLSCEPETLAPRPWRQEQFELPNHCMTMTYRLEPDLPDKSFRVLDCQQSDAPRVKKAEGNAEGNAENTASTIGIIGGADGPTAVVVSGKRISNGHTAISSLHFQPQKEVEWRIVFYEKLVEDREVTLLP